MKKIFIILFAILINCNIFAQINIPKSRINNGFVMTNSVFRGWGGVFNFSESGFEPVFKLNTPKLNQVRVYISDIPEFEKPFSRKRVNVVTFEIPDSSGTTLLRFYGINETIEMLKTINNVMQKCSGKDKLSKKEQTAFTKEIKRTIPKSAYFWDDYAGFNNKIEPVIILVKGSEPMVVLEGISYCRIKFKDLTSIVDPNFSGDENIKSEIQLPLDGIDKITKMVETLNFMNNIPSHRLRR